MLRVKSDPARFFIKKNSDSQLVGRDPKVGREDSEVSYKMQFIFTQTFKNLIYRLVLDLCPSSDVAWIFVSQNLHVQLHVAKYVGKILFLYGGIRKQQATLLED